MDENSQWYYTDSNGQQAGPVNLAQLRALIQQSAVTDQSMVWTEGMDDWKQVSEVDGLATTPSPSIPQPSPLAQPATVQAAPTSATTNPYAPPQTEVTAPITDDDYFIPDVKRTNYGLMVSTMIIGFVLLVVGVVQMESSTSSSYGYPSGAYSSSSSSVSTSSIILMLVGFAVLAFGGILSLIYLHRAWRVIQPGGATTTPGKAVGLLFVPLFNLYWYFIAYWKWSQDWNRIVSSHRKLAAAPRAGEGLFLAYAILNAVGVVVSLAGLGGLVVFFILMKQVCNSVNYMHDLRVSQPQQQSGGMSLY